ncbi:MAG: hypothetical protein AB7E37_08055 [Candidatus Altimarinota bacterium]
MDVILVSIGGSAVVVLITLLIGLKKVLDALSESSQKLEENTQALIDANVAKIEKKFSSDMTTLTQVISVSHSEFIQVLTEKENNLMKELKEQNNSLKNHYEKNSEKIALSLESKSSELVEKYQFATASMERLITNSSETVTQKLDGFLAIQDKYSLNIKSKLESNFMNMLQLVNNLRLDNLINVSNEIGKYKKGIYEDEHFLQEVGFCKIIKLTDKNSGEVTNVYYDENGDKSHTETYDKDTLKYAMKYENGKLKNGVEFNQNGEILFEYFYDDAEEISQKIEYIYDEKANILNKQETNY